MWGKIPPLLASFNPFNSTSLTKRISSSSHVSLPAESTAVRFSDMPVMLAARRRLGNSGAGGELLTKEQRGMAVARAREMLNEVSVGWEYSLPVKKKKVLDVGRREGSLGAWRPSGANSTSQEEILVTDEDDSSDMDTYDDEDYDDEDHMRAKSGVGGSSYRRATTPPPAAKRRRRHKRQQEGVWKRREDDSDVDLNIVPPDRVDEKYVWESPDDVPTPDKIRERQRRELEEEMEWNNGLRLWIHRRDAWTEANEDGEVRVGESRFKDNPLYTLINPTAYDQIYTKVCLGGSQPPIPINLKHLCNALVEGWKRDDQWPPKLSRPEPSIRVKKNTNNIATTATANTTLATVASAAGPGRKGRDTVKKVLGF